MKRIFERQGIHVGVYLLVGLALEGAMRALPEGQGRAWGLTTHQLVLLSWTFVGLMQAWISLAARAELYLGLLSRWFGRHAFSVFRVGFIGLAIPRLTLLVPIAQSSQATMGLPVWLRVALVVVTTPFILWGVHSIMKYFGLNRVLCADHFDPGYRNGELVRGGLFRYTSNVGYAIVLLLAYHPALFFDSLLGAVTAAAHHLLVWTSYFCFERPDMNHIYGAPKPPP